VDCWARAADEKRASEIVTVKEINRIESSPRKQWFYAFPPSIHCLSFAREPLTQPGSERRMGPPRGVLAMLDREEKELYVGWTAILIFAMALVYFQQ
jgi:hypothetical protein